jgi:hypothetical protein
MSRAMTGIDLTDRLRFAAGSLASDFGGDISVERAEALVFRSAEGLLAAASVTEFVPVLAERRARLTLRNALPAGIPPGPVPVPPAETIEARRRPDVEPLLAVPQRDLAELRERIERLRRRLAG